MTKLTLKQRKNIQNWEEMVKKLPKFNKPMFLIRFLARIMPDHCIFRRQVYWRGYLIVFIPTLCGLNPWFDAIIEEKVWQLENLEVL